MYKILISSHSFTCKITIKWNDRVILQNCGKLLINNLLPEKSKKIYEKEYKNFETWCIQSGVTKYTENVLLAYFFTISKNKKASTLWSSYSMLKSCILIKNISSFLKLIAFLYFHLGK